MAITRNESDNSSTLTLVITNGDLEALKNICTTWEIINEESVLRYAIAVMTKVTKSKTLYIEDDQGEKIGFWPSDSIRTSGVKNVDNGE